MRKTHNVVCFEQMQMTPRYTLATSIIWKGESYRLLLILLCKAINTTHFRLFRYDAEWRNYQWFVWMFITWLAYSCLRCSTCKCVSLWSINLIFHLIPVSFVHNYDFVSNTNRVAQWVCRDRCRNGSSLWRLKLHVISKPDKDTSQWFCDIR